MKLSKILSKLTKEEQDKVKAIIESQSSSYYMQQFNKINLKGEYAPKMLFVNGDGTKTNYMDLNKESMKTLITWLNKNKALIEQFYQEVD